MPRQNVILVAFIISASLLNCRGPEGPVGPPGAPGESLTDPRIQPQVIFTFPPANTVGPYEYFSERYNQIQFRFNKIMDRASVHDAVYLTSPNTKAHIDTSSVSSLGDDLWFSYPVDSPHFFYNFRWRIGETYTLGISSTAKDVNGNTLSPAFSMTFNPEPFFRIVRVNPPPGVSDVSKFSLIWIYFNSAVDTSTFSKIHITPPMRGLWNYGYGYYYPDSSTIYFSGTPFNNNTTYTIQVDASARDVDGHTLQQGFTTSFTTVAFRVWRSFPTDRSRNVNAYNGINVSFTAPLDTGSVRAAFSISPALQGTLAIYSGSNYFDFIPLPQMQPEATYTLTINNSLRSTDGVALSSPYQFSFTIAPFVVARTWPSEGETNLSRQTIVTVNCSAYIDSSTINPSFALKDSNGVAVGGTIFDSGRSNEFSFLPGTQLAPKAWYTGTVSIGLKALGGGPLKSEYIFSFRTGN